MIRFPLLLLFLLTGFVISAETVVSGKVTDPEGEALPFANVYVKGSSNGTTTNIDGRYTLRVSEGGHTIVFQHVGFRRHEEAIMVMGKPLEMDVILHPEDVQLSQVVISPDEDPAHAIMRKVIAGREKYLNQVNAYSCDVYIKGLQRITRAPEKILGQTINTYGLLDSNNTGIIYLSESRSKLYFKEPDKVREELYASKVSGDSGGFSWNKASDFLLNFYNNDIDIEVLSERPFVSPVADNAFFFYRYKLLGVIEEDGRLINKIEVIPRRQHDPVFRGVVYVVENDWNLHSLELTLTKDAQIAYADTLTIKQAFVPVNDSTPMLFSQSFNFSFSVLGIEARGYFVAVYSDYDLNPEFGKDFFSNEILTIEQEANDKDSAYWKQNRPVPLTEEEEQDYGRKDSLELLRESEAFLDSMDRISNKFTVGDIFFGYSYLRSYKNVRVHFNPVYNMFQYNTVEGYAIEVMAEIYKRLNEETRAGLEFTPAVRYGFSNRHFNAMLDVRHSYNRKKLAYWQVSGGRYAFQFDPDQPIKPFMNSFYSLFFEKNYLKIYEKAFGKLSHGFELVNGLFLATGLEYSRRFPLFNTTGNSWLENERFDFTPNFPVLASGEASGFEGHDAFNINVLLRFRPAQKYFTRPDMKVILESKYPEFTLKYLKSIPGVFSSELNYDFLQLAIKHDIDLDLFGNSSYWLAGGAFLNDSKITFPDYKHFTGNLTIFGQNYLTGFDLLDYYIYSTTDPFIEAHYEHHFDGFIINKIPGVRKTKFQLVGGSNFLYTDVSGPYFEVTAGIENILKIGRIDFVSALPYREAPRFSLRVGISLDQL